MSEYIKKYLETIGFYLKDGITEPIYEKTYSNLNNYKITITLDENDYTKSKIDYGTFIEIGRKTTENLHQKETFVVLECVDRLLTKGYSPKQIVLEKDYPNGRQEQGQWLDILVKKDDCSYYMIECKTWGSEYEKEKRNMCNNGGQLLTYYTNDRQVKALCLYTSKLEGNKIQAEYFIVDSSNFQGSSKKELYNHWNKRESNIDFFKSKELYAVNPTDITKDDLNRFSDDMKVYNGFARILRKYAVSDLTNAYNKLFNLFLCKIVDEDNNSEEVQFQWRNEETSYDVLDRLSNLYKKGIDDYLHIKVVDYSKTEFLKNIEALTQGDKEKKEDLLKEFNRLRFIKNNEFSFIEVFNEETFNQNCLILKDVVRLLERKKIKYGGKQQFLGDFFERLLNIGIKQTEGQFFTPIPIANFIVNSIPFEKVIKEKIEEGNSNFLPYMIDYACGAGHFITEYMHRIEPLLNNYNNFKNKNQSDNYLMWSNAPYKWAKEFVYGIEKDYRLTKTSKISCFLNGDGDANIITGSGLDSFDSEIFFNSILYEKLEKNEKYHRDHPVFDCVIANPPYSVQDFKDTLKGINEESYGDKNFALFNAFGDDSDDIECLFLERAKQLIKDGGYGAIIIPSSLLSLSNPSIYKKTRELIIENFKIKGIVELGSGAFMATGTDTIVLFMQKRKKDDIKEINYIIENFKNKPSDFNFHNKSQFISMYLKSTYSDLTFEDYISLFNNEVTENFKKSELYDDYIDSIIDKLENTKYKTKREDKKNQIQQEIDDILSGKQQIDLSSLRNNELRKIYTYLLNYDINTVLISSGETKDEIANFLGYKFSKRKGNEGLKELSDSFIKELNSYTNRENIKSKLYNPEKILDNSKVNYYIYKNLESNTISEEDIETMRKFFPKMFFGKLNDLFDYSTIDFISDINKRHKEKLIVESKCNKYEKIRKLVRIKYGTRIVKDKDSGDIFPVYGGGGKTFKANTYNRENCYIISRFGMSKNCVRYVEGKFFLNDSGFTTEIKNPNKYNKQYIDYILSANEDLVYNCGRGSSQKNIDMSMFKNIKIPTPKFETQNIIAEEINKNPSKKQEILNKYLK